MSAAAVVNSSPALWADAVFLKLLPMVTSPHVIPKTAESLLHMTLTYLKAGDPPLFPLVHLSSNKPWLPSPDTFLVFSPALSYF